MTALAYILAGIIAGCVGLIAWLVHGRISDKGRSADARVGQVIAESKTERASYELIVTQKALAASNIRARALEEELTNALDQPSLADGLDAADVAGRVRRLAERWREAAVARNPLPAESGAAVPVEPAAADPKPAVVHGRDDLIDVLL